MNSPPPLLSHSFHHAEVMALSLAVGEVGTLVKDVYYIKHELLRVFQSWEPRDQAGRKGEGGQKDVAIALRALCRGKNFANYKVRILPFHIDVLIWIPACRYYFPNCIRLGLQRRFLIELSLLTCSPGRGWGWGGGRWGLTPGRPLLGQEFCKLRCEEFVVSHRCPCLRWQCSMDFIGGCLVMCLELVSLVEPTTRHACDPCQGFDVCGKPPFLCESKYPLERGSQDRQIP